ncbi:MAG TPA: imidazoleglycerol-phosphate dehydratase, partial [Spirochaetota bacterium]|nr:imidazoleglycerol-phosphate dehydratase [Spirochaetota bacterium]
MMETVERKAVITRKTGETDITLKLTLQGIEKSRIVSGVPFFDHMLDAMSRHGRFFLDLACRGDHAVDDHHSVED